MDRVAAEQIGAHLLGVLQLVPEFGLQSLDVRNALKDQRPVVAFFGAKENHTTVGVGHGAVGLPKGEGQRALPVGSCGQLGLKVPVLVKGLQVLWGHGVELERFDLIVLPPFQPLPSQAMGPRESKAGHGSWRVSLALLTRRPEGL